MKEEPAVSSAAAPTAPRGSARERLLAAANELFYAQGVQTVGIDRIIERAGVAKASLYNLFGSKEELVAAYLASRRDGTTSRINEVIEEFDDPRLKILAVFDAQAEQYERADFNGCAFMAACTEARPGGLIERAADEFRSWIRAMFTDLAEQVAPRIRQISDTSSISSTTAPGWRDAWTITIPRSRLPLATPLRR
jgi:AcrR family transcriptional regulator